MDSCLSGVTCEVIHGKALYRKNLSRSHHNEDIKVARWENDSWDCRASAAQLGFVGNRARYREGQRRSLDQPPFHPPLFPMMRAWLQLAHISIAHRANRNLFFPWHLFFFSLLGAGRWSGRGKACRLVSCVQCARQAEEDHTVRVSFRSLLTTLMLLG